MLLVKTAISSTKKAKRQCKRKLLKMNISFITLKDFRRLCPLICFVMPTSKRNYQCGFLILVQSFSTCTYSRIVDCFQYKLSSVWSYIFLLNGPDKMPKQKSSKTKRHSQQQEAESVRRRTTASQQDFFWCVVTGTLG